MVFAQSDWLKQKINAKTTTTTKNHRKSVAEIIYWFQLTKSLPKKSTISQTLDDNSM